MTADVKKIIFIEDEKALIDMYRGIFEKENFVFITTSDINKALALTESEKPDAVLLDIIIPMPENTVAEQGYDYLVAVKNNNKIKDIPVIVFTNLDTPQDRKKCKEMGAAAYIFKRDCTPKEVTDTVLEVIRRSRG
jgi:DNA-binding response OmpR family regulator